MEAMRLQRRLQRQAPRAGMRWSGWCPAWTRSSRCSAWTRSPISRCHGSGSGSTTLAAVGLSSVAVVPSLLTNAECWRRPLPTQKVLDDLPPRQLLQILLQSSMKKIVLHWSLQARLWRQSISHSSMRIWILLVHQAFVLVFNFAQAGSSITPTKPTSVSPFSFGLQIEQFFAFKDKVTKLLSKGDMYRKYTPREDYFSEGLYMFDIGQNDLACEFYSKTEDQVIASIPTILLEFENGLKRSSRIKRQIDFSQSEPNNPQGKQQKIQSALLHR